MRVRTKWHERAERLVAAVTRVAEWSAAVRSGTTSSCVAVGSGVALVLPRSITALVIGTGAARSAVVGGGAISLSEVVDELRKLLLHDLDALRDDGIGLQVTSALDLEVESTGLGIVVKRLAGLTRLLELGVLAGGPAMKLVSIQSAVSIAITYHSVSALAPGSFDSNQRSVWPSLL